MQEVLANLRVTSIRNTSPGPLEMLMGGVFSVILTWQWTTMLLGPSYMRSRSDKVCLITKVIELSSRDHLVLGRMCYMLSANDTGTYYFVTGTKDSGRSYDI